MLRQTGGFARAAAVFLITFAAALAAAAPQANAQPSESEQRAEAEALFQRMLANPNDLDAAFRYASLEAALGDQEAAIGALERMLFYNADLPRVRLELGVLYFKLGSYEMARANFEAAVVAADTPEDVREKVAGFLREIDRRVADNQLLFFGSGGLRYQSNANIGPDSAVVRALGNDAVLSQQYLRRADTNAFVSAGLRHVYDFQNQRGDTWETNAAFLDTRQFRVSRLNLGIAQVDTGPRIAIGDYGSGFSIRPYAIGAGVLLGDRPYLGSPGAGLSARWLSLSGLLIEPGAEVSSRRFFNSGPYPNATQQNGSQYTFFVNLGAPVPFFAPWRATVRPFFARAITRYQPYAYDQTGVDVVLSTDFAAPIPTWSERPWNFAAFGGVSYTRYRTPDAIVDPVTFRRDTNWRVGTALDMPIYQWLGVAAQVAYTRTASTVANFKNRNFSVSLAPSFRF